MKLLIEDPRKFSEIYPNSNMLINQALYDVSSGDDDGLICALIEDMLKQKQDGVLSVGFNLAPNLKVANYIWDALQHTINSPSNTTCLFAVPIVIVAGSTKQVEINYQVNVSSILELLIKNNVVSSNTKLATSLIDIEQIAKFKPSQLFDLANSPVSDIDLDSLISACSVSNVGEHVYLCYLIGCTEISNQPEFALANFNKCNMDFMQLILDNLKNDELTVFPITFTPCFLSNATIVGRYHHNEITIIFKLSSEVKKYRLQGKVPFVKVGTIDNSIKLQLAIRDSHEIGITLNWLLHPVDSFEQIIEKLAILFSDMHLDVVYI